MGECVIGRRYWVVAGAPQSFSGSSRIRAGHSPIFRKTCPGSALEKHAGDSLEEIVTVDVAFRRFEVAAIFALSLLYSVSVASDVGESQRDEVRHLLEFVRDSSCAIERNGKRYNGEDAYAHIRKKYHYFRDEIQSSEDFIEFSATKSTLSGKHYLVFCDSEPPMRTKDWLVDELNALRGR
jgi:hypothetical protein